MASSHQLSLRTVDDYCAAKRGIFFQLRVVCIVACSSACLHAIYVLVRGACYCCSSMYRRAMRPRGGSGIWVTNSFYGFSSFFYVFRDAFLGIRLVDNSCIMHQSSIEVLAKSEGQGTSKIDQQRKRLGGGGGHGSAPLSLRHEAASSKHTAPPMLRTCVRCLLLFNNVARLHAFRMI